MGRPNKIVQYNLQKVVADAIADGKSSRQIAEMCSRKAKQSISHVAVNEYIKTIDQGVKKHEVVRSSERVARIVNFDIDIIDLQYRTTAALLERFEFVDSLPRMFEERINDLATRIEAGNTDDLHNWKIGFVDDLRRNVTSITTLNRELRENSKFMADLRSRAFEFDLIQEYLYLFMEVFRKANPEAYEVATAQIAANPRMQRIVEQQQQLRGGDAE